MSTDTLQNGSSIFDQRRFDEHEGAFEPPPPQPDDPFEPYLTDTLTDRSNAEVDEFKPLFVDGAIAGSASSAADGTDTQADDLAAPDGEPAMDDGASETEPADEAAATDENGDSSAEETPLHETEEPPPTFDEEAVEAARKAGFDEGMAAGRTEAESSAETQTAQSLEKIADALAGIDRDRNDEIAEAASDALGIAMAVVRKLFPTLRTKLAEKEIRAFVAQRLGDAGEARMLKVQVHDDLCESITTQMTELAKQSGFSGTVSVQGDPELDLGDVRLDWRDGGVERIYETLWTGLEAALTRSIGPLDPSAKATAARPVKKQKPQAASAAKRPTETPASPTQSAPQTA